MSPPSDQDRDRALTLERIRSTYAGYDRRGRQRLWDAANRGYARLARDLRGRVVAEMRRSTSGGFCRVLDLGCGTGDLYADALQAGIVSDWTGVDLRPEAIEEARARYAEPTFIVASADRVPDPDESYDIVIAQVLFSSLPSHSLQRDVVAEVHRLLAPGGWLIWSDLRYSNPTNRSVQGVGVRDLRRLFDGWTIEVRTAGLLPPLARRLGVLAPTYSALSALAPLRSHFVGRLQPPKKR